MERAVVATQIVDKRRITISLSLDAALVEYLDAYGAEHPMLNRSRIVEVAVREYWQRQMESALEAQYAEPESEEIRRELGDWRRIRRAALHDLVKD